MPSHQANPPYYVNVHVKSGESLAIQLFDGNKRFVTGPATITMPSHQAYPPIPIPINLPPGHSMQQIVDENGVLKHIIIGSPSSSTSESMSKNQILTKNGAKNSSHNINGTRSSSFKKKSIQSNGGNNESTFNSKQVNRYNRLTNDALISNSTSLINSNSLIYPICCCCCPECMPNNQLNSSSVNLFSNINNELNYMRPNFYTINSSNSITTGKQSTLNNHTRRSFTNTNNSSISIKSNRNDKLNENGRSANARDSLIVTNSINGIKNNFNNNSKSGKTINKQPILNSSNLINYSKTPKAALLSTKQICKQCMPNTDNYSYNYSNNQFYNSNYNQKYLYSNSYHQSSVYQSNSNNHNNLYQTNSTNKNLQQLKYSYASDATKQSSNRNQRASKSNHLISQAPHHPPSSQSSLLGNGTMTETGRVNSGYIMTSKKESDNYLELIRYVNSNHMSAFKSHKRIDLDTSKSHSQLNKQDTKGQNSHSVTASSSPISEHYDFSSEESEQINYKQTSLLGYPTTNCSTNYGYSNSYSSGCSHYSISNGSSTNSSSSNSSANNNQLPNMRNRNSGYNDIVMNEKNTGDSLNEISKEIRQKFSEPSKIIITNDDDDDGYEDDFELKNCDSKSNDYVETDSRVIEEISQDQLTDHEIKFINDRQMENLTTINEISVVKCDKTESIENAMSEKILDENSNEIGSIDRNLFVQKPDKTDSKCCEPTVHHDYGKDYRTKEDESKSNPVEEAKEQSLENKSLSQSNKSNDVIIKEIKPIKKKQEPIKVITFALSYTKLTGLYVKLKWTVLNNGNNIYAIAKENQFMVEMIYSKEKDANHTDTASTKASRIVYTGLVKHCKIQCLKPFEEYSFRVKLLYNDHQLISNLLTITTPELQIQPANAKKRTNKNNLQFSLQQQQILKQQQIIIEQKEKELQLKQSQLNQQQTSSRSISLFSLLCAITTMFKDNFAYLLIIFFSISAFFFANFISKDLLNCLTSSSDIIK